MITRDPRQAARLIGRIRELGGETVLMPTIRITGPGRWSQVDKVIDELRKFDWIVFTSPNGVRYFLERVKEKNMALDDIKIGTVGKKTSSELGKYQLEASLIPGEYSARGLLNAFDKIPVRNKKFLLPVSNIAGSELDTGLTERGALVSRVVVYRTRKINHRPDQDDQPVNDLRNGRIHCITFFSPSAFNSFARMVGDQTLDFMNRRRITIAAIGPATARAIEKKALKVSILPEESHEDSLINALVAYYGK